MAYRLFYVNKLSYGKNPVVNKNEETMFLLKMWLERKNYKVKYTANQQEVPHLVREFNPRLVIVDYTAPEPSGHACK